MLQLNNITKRYEAGEFSVDALKGISLNFRKSEFVSILGPSGCGKTTLLNIVGGLDKYTDGDLVINGKSTKNFSDRDWDAYRNHSIGFVFQSYNLIPHQSVLQNVELALALSGVKKAERVARAKAALDSVGLKNMYSKRPSEMSGGQMQRVAIARAIVNNPDIILADEPTGALDTETSVQVMDILKEISKDRLVVMVTHNPDLAEKYSTRIVRILDGLLVDDTLPLTEEELIAEQQADSNLIAEEAAVPKSKRKKKPSMSFATSFMLSLKNLFTKRGRTTLTSFAGSIGIIGIALIFAVSQGTSNYIAAVQEDTLASYPLTIEQTHTDMSSMFASFVESASSSNSHEVDQSVYEKLALYNLTGAISKLEQTENDLASFKRHLDNGMADEDSVFYKSLNGIHYSYNLDMLIYTRNAQDGTVMRSDTSELMLDLIGALYGVDVSSISMTGSGLMSMLASSSTTMSSLWEEILPAKDGGAVNDLLKSQYDLIYGKWPDNGSMGKNQVVLVVDENNEIDDMTLYALGLKSRAEIDAVIEAARNGQEAPKTSAKHWTFEEICSQKYKTIFNFQCYRYSDTLGIYYDIRDIDGGTEALYINPNVGLELEIVGIIRPNTSASSHMLSGTIGYSYELTKYVIEQANASDIVLAQKSDEYKDVDIFNGKYFKNNSFSDEKKAQIFRSEVAKMSNDEKAMQYVMIKSLPLDEQTASVVESWTAMEEGDLRNAIQNLMGRAAGMPGGDALSSMAPYLDSMSFEQLQSLIPTLAPLQARLDNVTQIYAGAAMEAYSSGKEMTQVLAEKMGTLTLEGDQECAAYFDMVIEFSDNTYEDNLVKLGCLDLSAPSTISLYAVSFAAKEDIEQAIADYNNSVEESRRIAYTDFVGIIMSSVTTILNAITYVLIGFVSISLVVSSIMIGVITLISVQERTKEIGILRAIGASKRNVSGMFNAETVIIGFTSGLFGVGITYVLCLLVNVILHAATGIATLNATLPIWTAAVLVGISMLLTLIAGIIPSRSAAKKDPVVALRTE